MRFKDFLLVCDNSELLKVYIGKNTLDCKFNGEMLVEHALLLEGFENYKVNKFFSIDNVNSNFQDSTCTEVYITEV